MAWYDIKEECPDPPNCTASQSFNHIEHNAMVAYLKDKIRGMPFTAPLAGDNGKYLKYVHGTPGFVLDVPAGAGDMLKSVYDPNEDNIIALAQLALPSTIANILTDHDKAAHDALAIAWISLTGTPASFSGQKGMLPRVNNGEATLEFKHNAIPTTFMVAATVGNDCVDPLRADDQCDGTNDQIEINSAITALP